MKVLVTGGSGLLGKSLRKIKPEYVYLDSKSGDLRNSAVVENLLDAEQPDKIIHAAAIVGGIQDNVKNPFKYFTDNVLINTNVVSAAVKREIPVVAISSTCVFPKESAVYPMTEEMALAGDPEPTNYEYAIAKRTMQIQLKSAEKQFGYKSAVLYLSNLYGEHDHFEGDKAHLVTALLRKMHRAKQENSETVDLLGTGRPLRQFLYAGDAARILAEIVENDVYDIFNVCPEENLSVREIAEIVQNCVGFNGKLRFSGALDGVYRKDATPQKLLARFPNYQFRSLREGVLKTYDKVKHLL